MAACCTSLADITVVACNTIGSLCHTKTQIATPVPGYGDKQKDLPVDPDEYKDNYNGPAKKKRKRQIPKARFIDFPYRIYASVFPSQATKQKGYCRVQTYDLL